MNAEELATSLLRLSAVLEEANTVIHGSHSAMFIKVRSSFRPGSFNVDIVTFFTSTAFQALSNIITLVGFTGDGIGSLIWLHKQTKGENVVKKEEVDESKYNVTFNNCENPIIVNANVLNLYENAAIRKDFGKIVHPLENKAIDNIVFLEDNVECQRIRKDEKEYFPQIDNEIIDEKEGIDYFLITQSNFTGKQTGWRLKPVSPTLSKKIQDFQVTILDNAFLHRVKKEDIIVSNKRTIIKARYKKTIRRNERESTNWEILNVFEDDDDVFITN